MKIKRTIRVDNGHYLVYSKKVAEYSTKLLTSAIDYTVYYAWMELGSPEEFTITLEAKNRNLGGFKV